MTVDMSSDKMQLYPTENRGRQMPQSYILASGNMTKGGKGEFLLALIGNRNCKDVTNWIKSLFSY